jgi:hypothetical protein
MIRRAQSRTGRRCAALWPTLLLALGLTTPLAAAERPPVVETFGAGAAARWSTFGGTWTFDDGALRQTTSTFDCGAVLTDPVDGPYTISVRFRPGPFTGGGLYFGLPHSDRRDGGMMIRCDVGGSVLWGCFDDGGDYELYGSYTGAEVRGDEHELAVAVDPALNAANIYYNGRRIATGVKVYRPTGYVGVQSSGGPHTFTRFELRAPTPAELAGLAEPNAYRGIIDLLGDDTGLVALRLGEACLARFDADGREVLVRRISDLRGLSGPELRPVAIAWDAAPAGAAPGVVLLAEDGTALFRLDADLQPVGDGPIVRLPDMRATDVAVDAAGRIFVSDPAIPGIRVFDAAGQPLLAFGQAGKWRGYDYPTPARSGQFGYPRGIAISHDGLIAVTDRDCETYCVYRYDAAQNAFTWVTHGTHLPRPYRVLFDRQGQILIAGAAEPYSPYGALRVVTLHGTRVRHFLGHALDCLSEKLSVAEGPGGRLYLADASKDRVCILPPNFVEQRPAFAWTADGDLQMTMALVDGRTVTTTGRARTADGTRLVVGQQESVCPTWPPILAADLRTYALPPAPPAGQMHVIDMPVLIAVFTKVETTDGKQYEIPADGVLARLHREFEPVREHHYRNSHCVLNVQYEYMLIDDAVAPVDGVWIPPEPGRRLTNEARVKRGLPPVDADHSVIAVHALTEFDPAITDALGTVGGAGLTPFAYCGFGLYNHGVAWLMSHEWGHQLDAYFDKTGVPDWPVNHPDATVHPGRYSDSWDVNSFICRDADPMNWLRFRFGTLRLAADRDGDGLPDDDATLPMDERRFGSDPTRVDTDGDGLSDLAEYMAGTFTSSDPRVVDTNGDGIPDGRQPNPQHRVTPVARPAGAAGDDTRIGTIRADWCDGDVAAHWAPDTLTLVFTLRQAPKRLTAHIDLQDDGWFAGRDNVYIEVDLAPGDNGQLAVTRTDKCTATATTADGVTIVTVDVPRPPLTEPLQSGGRVGIMPRFWNGVGTVAFLIDPFASLSITLE